MSRFGVSAWQRRAGVLAGVGYEGDLVVRAFGWRVRFYAGHGFADRPRVDYWRAWGSRGLALRAHRGYREQRVLGVQWRRLDA